MKLNHYILIKKMKISNELNNIEIKIKIDNFFKKYVINDKNEYFEISQKLYNIKNKLLNINKHNFKKLEESQIRGICYHINAFHQVCFTYISLFYLFCLIFIALGS